MELTGTVWGDPTLFEECCVFPLEGKEEGLYLILSMDRQALKDAIFIERGQKLQIKGSVLGQDSLKGILVTESARIEIARKETEKV